MNSTYLSYLSAIVSDKLTHEMEYDCWRMGLELNQSSFGFESAPFFLDNGVFHFGYHKYPIDCMADDLFDFIKDGLLNGYYILGWIRESFAGMDSIDSYLIYGCDTKTKSLSLVFMFDRDLQKCQISIRDFQRIFMSRKYHNKDGYARMYFIKENSLWDIRQSKARVDLMVERYLNSQSIWGYNHDGCLYGIEAKRLVWEKGFTRTTFIRQTESIYQMLRHLPEVELAKAYHDIHWSYPGAIDVERQILSDFRRYLK